MSPVVRRGPRRPPVERVRSMLARAAGSAVASQLPTGYQRLGRVLAVRWPEALRPYFGLLAESFRHELGVVTVLRYRGAVEGELRTPTVERLAGSETETEVTEHGVHWTFDAARVMFAAGNRTERHRAALLTRPGESVVDLFAGIGYFAVPAAKLGGAGHVVAVEKNPVSAEYLRSNIQRNGVGDRVEIRVGDNRTLDLPLASADRVFLGYLPSSLPWIERALALVRDDAGWLHVHLVVDSTEARPTGERLATQALLDAGGTLLEPARGREVKSYGPGRTHVVVDVRVRPPRR